ncbi:hypothetical protein D3C71_2047860 [compost metagenome]
MRALQKSSKIAGHDAGRGEGFAGVGQEGFGVDVGGDEKHRAGVAWWCRGFRGIGGGFEHGQAP